MRLLDGRYRIGSMCEHIVSSRRPIRVPSAYLGPGRRKALLPSAVPSAPSQQQMRKVDSHTPFWVEDQQTVYFFPASPTPARNKKEPLLLNTITAPSIIFPLCPDHLITLLQYNALRACITNQIILRPITLEASSPTQECATAAAHVLPVPSIPSSVPLSLYPTDLQRTIPHESWVDIIPHPLWRDNVLRSLGTFDEDELWSDSIGGLFDGFPDDEIEKRGVISWNTPWDMSGWEVSEGFWRKWGWLMRGCEREVQEWTNHWRLMRGEDPVKWVCEAENNRDDDE